MSTAKVDYQIVFHVPWESMFCRELLRVSHFLDPQNTMRTHTPAQTHTHAHTHSFISLPFQLLASPFWQPLLIIYFQLISGFLFAFLLLPSLLSYMPGPRPRSPLAMPYASS